MNNYKFKKPKIAIIGCGASGLFSAYKLSQSGFDITIFDKSNPGSTLLLTGNGRCNLAYNENSARELASYYPRGEKFLYSVFSKYGLFDTLNDFKKINIEAYIQSDNRIFPKSNSAKDVKDKLLATLINKVKFERKEITEPLTGYDAVILATGLKSGADLAKKYGHKIIPLVPVLCGFKIKETEFLSLQGVSFNGVIFTNVGVSGPFIYKLSSENAYKSYPYQISIPLIKFDDLYKAVNDNPKKLFRTVVSDFIPKSLANILVKTDKQCANVTKQEIFNLEFLKLTVTSTDGKGEIVHAGGVDLNEVDNNMKSKIVDNLWIIGEVLNVDGLTGGFNLQFCWSSASIASENIIKRFGI